MSCYPSDEAQIKSVDSVRGAYRAALSCAGVLVAVLLASCTVTPEPITDNQRELRAAADLKIIHVSQFTPDKPITLYDAMARAVAFNLQHNVRQIERDIARLELEQANQEGYPDVEGNAGFNGDSEVTSLGTDRNIRTGSIGATWNILDLGVSYARAKQSADRVLIAEERRRKALQDIIRNVRLAYWKTVGAQQMMARMVSIENDFSIALSESRRLEIHNVETRRRTIGFRRGLVDTVRQIIAARKEYGRARIEFAQLINIQPGAHFTLQLPATLQGIPALPMAVDDMESFALEQRPELRVEDYNERITEWESREALYSMFPGLDLNLSRSFSSDSGLATGSWTGVGSALAMNLFRLFSGPLRMETAELRGEMARRQRLALSIAVLAQVHISYREFYEAGYQFRLARQIARSDRELSKLAMSERNITHGNLLDTIDVAARQLRSQVQQHQAYVELRRAHGNILHSLGLDVIGNDVPLDDVNRLRTAIRQTVAKWETLTIEPDLDSDQTIEALVEQVLADTRRETGMPVHRVRVEQFGPLLPPELESSNVAEPGDDNAPPIWTKGDGNYIADPGAASVTGRLEPKTGVVNEPMAILQAARPSEAEPGDEFYAYDGSAPGRRDGIMDMPLDKFRDWVGHPALNEPPVQQQAAYALMPTPEEKETPPLAPARNAVGETPNHPAEIRMFPAGSTDDAQRRPDSETVYDQLPGSQRYDAQFGAFAEFVRARALMRKLQHLNLASGKGRRLQLQTNQSPGKTPLFHVTFGSYIERTAALEACSHFKDQGQSCFVVRHKEAEAETVSK